MMKARIGLIALAATAMLVGPAVATAAVVYLDFEGIAPYPSGNAVLILDYYDGGAASNGNIGPDFGVQFSGGATLLCLNNIGTLCSNTSRGDVGIATSRQGAMFFPLSNPFMNVAAGFDTGFSFVYSSPFIATGVEIWSGLSGSGVLLASALLPITPDGRLGGCNVAYDANYCPFIAFGITFDGIAQSVVFTGQVNAQVFDDFTFGSETPGGGVGVPEPGTLALLGLGLLGLGLGRRQRSISSN